MSIAKPPTHYTVDLPAFAGPLDLLLYLIERDELDITAISLAQVTGQYLAQIEKLKRDRMEELIDFLAVGARLVLIKSRALLPHEPAMATDEEEEDPAEALVRQLREYRRFKQAASYLQQREEDGLRTYLRIAAPLPTRGQLDLSGVTAVSLRAAMQEVVERAELLEESVSLVEPASLTIQGQIERLRFRMRSNTRVDFAELLSLDSTHQEIAVTLLALLELVKRREVVVVQEALFGPIEIRPGSGS